jgi:hypothetical protein
MNNMAKLYFELSEGIWIRDNPAALTMFFNTGEGTVIRSAEKRKSEPCPASGVVVLDVGPNPMAKWVHEKLPRFAAYKTTPQAPPGAKTVAVST